MLAIENSIILYDYKNEQDYLELINHTDKVITLKLFDDDYLASGGRDNLIIV